MRAAEPDPVASALDRRLEELEEETRTLEREIEELRERVRTLPSVHDVRSRASTPGGGEDA